MARVTFSVAAGTDIEEILTDLAAKAGVLVAAKYVGLFQQLFVNLGDHPGLGAPRPSIGKNIRIAVISPFIVIYRHIKKADTVAVLRIMDGRRRISGRMLPVTGG